MIPLHIKLRLEHIEDFCLTFSTPYSNPETELPAIMDAVASYPLAIVSCTDEKKQHDFLRGIKSRNPDILILGYCNLVLSPTKWNRPDDRAKYQCKRFAKDKAGNIVASAWGSYLDPQDTIWQRAVVRSSEDVMDSWQFDGLFFDDCGVSSAMFNSMDSVALVKIDTAIRSAVKNIRAALPHALMIGNTNALTGSHIYDGLDGFMYEKETPDWTRFSKINGQIQLYLNNGSSPDKTADKIKCKDVGAIYYASNNYSSVS